MPSLDDEVDYADTETVVLTLDTDKAIASGNKQRRWRVPRGSVNSLTRLRETIQVFRHLPEPPYIRELAIINADGSEDLIHGSMFGFFVKNGYLSFRVDIRARQCPPLIYRDEELLKELTGMWEEGKLPKEYDDILILEKKARLPERTIGMFRKYMKYRDVKEGRKVPRRHNDGDDDGGDELLEGGDGQVQLEVR